MTLVHLLSALVLVAVAALAVALRRLSRLGGRLQALESQGTVLEGDLAALRRHTSQAELEQQFLSRVVRELPYVAHELHSGAGSRQIPGLLLGAVTRLLEPRHAVVLVRRRAAESDPDRHTRLAVAAVSPSGFLEVGAEVPIGHGEIGYAAEIQRVMDRRDFDNETPATRKRLRDETASGFLPDVVAPMIVGGQVVGALAVEGAKAGGAAKDALRLLAQVGAVSVHAQARYTEIKATAATDGLTGIFNKRYLTHRLAEEVRRAQDEVSCLSVFLFDVDNFKHYNDRNGHVSGDRLLQSLVRVVRENLRKDCIFGRYGGEEFLVVFPGAQRQQALAAAENVRRAIAAHDFAFGFDQPLGCVSVSGGVAESPVDGLDATALLQAADQALYRAKRSGRNRVLAYEPTYLGEGEAQQPATSDSDFTPVPGTLMSLATITPARGVPRLTLEPTSERLSAAFVPARRGPSGGGKD